MADEKPKAAEEEPSYSIEDLQARARVTFGVSPHVVFGVLTTDRKQTFTIAEAQKRIDAAGKRPAETDLVEEVEAE